MIFVANWINNQWWATRTPWCRFLEEHSAIFKPQFWAFVASVLNPPPPPPQLPRLLLLRQTTSSLLQVRFSFAIPSHRCCPNMIQMVFALNLILFFSCRFQVCLGHWTRDPWKMRFLPMGRLLKVIVNVEFKPFMSCSLHVRRNV